MCSIVVNPGVLLVLIFIYVAQVEQRLNRSFPFGNKCNCLGGVNQQSGGSRLDALA